MFNEGDIVQPKIKSDWPGIGLGIIEKSIIPHLYINKNICQVRFEYRQYKLSHFTVPFDEDLLEKV